MAQKDKYQDLGKAFLQDIWGKRERGLPDTMIDWTGPVRHEDVQYLLSRYPFLQIINTDAHFPEGGVEPKFIKADSGWVIHDYGDAMSASPGDLLYGNYSEKEGEEGGEGSGGKGTIIKQAYLTAQEMIAIAIQKQWQGINIIDGSPLMKWAAWMAAEDQEFGYSGYEPSDEDHKKRARVRKYIAEISKETLRSRLGLK